MLGELKESTGADAIASTLTATSGTPLEGYASESVSQVV